jgi:hypothetical protein
VTAPLVETAVETASPVERLAATSTLAPRLQLPPADPDASAPLPLDPVLLGAGLNVAGRSFARALLGWKHYPGSVEAICRAVIDDCWTGAFFAGSAGHFHQFWTRDLAMCSPALVALGQRDRVVRSWAWALERFERAGRITTTIFAGRFARDVYSYGCDSLPLLLFGLRAAGAEHLIDRYSALIGRETELYRRTVFDAARGMVRDDGYFSSPRDCMTGRSTAFANASLALLARQLDELPQLPNPFRGTDVAGAMLRQHWMGNYFRDSLCRDVPSGDANVWPFFFGIFTEPEMQRRAFATLEAGGFAHPVPLRYFQRRLRDSELPVPRWFTPNYQGDTSWTQLGPAYLQLLARIDRPLMEHHRARMAALIARDRNYLEVYTPEGKPYRGRGLVYHADEGMLWAAMFLALYD